MSNSAEQGGCYPQRPKAGVDNTLRDLQNSSCPTKAEFNNCFIIHSKYLLVLKGVSPFRSLFFRSPHHLTTNIQYGGDSFQIWWTAAGYGELCVWFYFNQSETGKYFEWIIISVPRSEQFFEENCGLRGTDNVQGQISELIIQQIVTLSKYGHDALDICHP